MDITLKSETRKHCIWIRAFLNNKFVGDVRVVEDEDTWFICMLQVDEEFQRRGIGSALMREALKQSKGHDLTLSCSHDLVSFYERFGFKIRNTVLEIVWMILKNENINK